MSIVINSASMETVNDSNTTVLGCMTKIQHALENHDVFESNYLYFMNSPMVKKLKRLNEKLRNQNKEYKMIIRELTSKLDKTSSKKRVYEEVKIKIEPTRLNTAQKEVIDLVDDDGDDDVILEKNCSMDEVAQNQNGMIPGAISESSNHKPNIVYEIIDELEENNTGDDHDEPVEDNCIVTPSRIENARGNVNLPLESPPEGGDLNRQRCKEAVIDNSEEADEEEEEEEKESEEEEEEKESEEEEEEKESEEEEEEKESEEEEEDEEEKEAEEDEEEKEAEEDEEEEVFEITISGIKYYTSNETNGVIYSITDDNDIGDKVGVFKNKIPEFLVNASSAVVEKEKILPTTNDVEEIETEEEVFEISVNGTKYYTSNETNGMIYSITEDGEIGDEVGNFVKGVFVMKM